jgi:1-deoxy-D-xylulose-5-phosphate synthase
MVKQALVAAELLAEQSISTAVYNMIWVKPLDTELLEKLSDFKLVATLEEGSLSGGFGSAVLEALAESGSLFADDAPVLKRFGIPDRFITHGSPQELLADLGLTGEALAKSIKDLL